MTGARDWRESVKLAVLFAVIGIPAAIASRLLARRMWKQWERRSK